MKTLVIIPTFNEISTLPILIESLAPMLSEKLMLLVVDDSSPDGTGEYIKRLDDKFIMLLSNSHKKGLGRAYLKGFLWAVSNEFDYIITMDADGSHPVEVIREFLEKKSNDKIIIASRYANAFDFIKYKSWRLWLSGIINNFFRIIFRFPIRDITGGFKCYPVESLKKIVLDNHLSKGFFFQVEILLLLLKANSSFEEISFRFRNRKGGKSKFSINIIMEAVLKTIRYVIKRQIN